MTLCFINSNKEILIKRDLLHYKNATFEEYESVMAKVNGSESISLELEECSLSKQLDNVSSLHLCIG